MPEAINLTRSLRGIGLLAVLALCLSCAEGTQTPPGPSTVRAYLSKDPPSLSLLGKTDESAQELAVQITDSLVQYDEHLELQPRLARSWEFSPDRLTVTFRLREGVRWHDGAPVTADDVVFSVNKVREPATENRVWAPLFRDLESVDAADPLTVRARYSMATPDVLEGWRLPILPRHLAGEDEDLINGSFAEHPVGCGPYRFVEHERDRRIVLEANDDYWDGRPRIDRLIYNFFTDQRTAYQELLTGGMDIMPVTSNLWEEARDSQHATHLERVLYYRFRLWVMMWNQLGNSPFFMDARVRKAMVLALDREQFVKSVMYGLGRPGITTYHTDPTWADERIGAIPFDLSEAARLLDDAGWVDSDGDGIRDRDGRPFSFELLVANSAQKLPDHIAAWQQQSWAELGLRAEIVKLEWQAFRDRRNAGNFDAAGFTLSMTPNPDQFELYHSSANETGFNFYGLSDPEVDRLIEEGRETFDPEARGEIYDRLQQRLAELEPLTCLFHFATPLLHDRRLSGIVPSAIGYATTTEGPRRWYWSDGADRD